MEKVIEEYKLSVDDVTAKVQIIKPDYKSPLYKLVKSEIAAPTIALLDEVKNKLIERIKLSSEEILDQKIIEKLKDRFRSEASIILKEYLNDLSEGTKTYLIGTLIHDSLGLGNMEFLLHDQLIEEIVVSSAKEPVRVYHKKHGWLETNIVMQSEDQILNYSNVIARRIGRQITNLNPLLDAHLLTGDRVNAVLYPIATKGNTITLRKFSTDPITVTDMIKSNISSSEVFSLIWLALEYEMNMLISGGTASGKCVIGNTPIYLTDGKIVDIGDLVESKFRNEDIQKNDAWEYVNGDGTEILSLNLDSLKISKNKIDKFWRHKAPKKLFRLIMRSGREVTSTGEHPFFTLENGCLTKIKAENIKFKDRIAVPNKLPLKLNRRDINLISYLENENDIYIENVKKDVKIIFDKLKKKYSLTLELLAKKLGYKKFTFRSWARDNSVPACDFFRLCNLAKYKTNEEFLLKSRTGKLDKNSIKIPKVCPDLFRFMALLIGDGHLTKNYLELHNSNLEILNEFLELGKKLFNANGKIRYPKNRVTKALINCKVLSTLSNKAFAIPYGNKARKVIVPKTLLMQDNECVSAFISGIMDCESYIGKSTIEISSMSRQMLKELSSLFLRLEITSTLSRKKSSLFVYGLDNFIKIKKFVPLRNLDKANSLDSLLSYSQKSHNINTIPNLKGNLEKLRIAVNLDRKDFAEKIGVSQRLIGMWENGSRNPTLSTIGKVLEFTEDSTLREIYESDIFWDEVIEVKILNEHNEKYVYDLTVLNDHNFIAGEIPLFTNNTTFLNVCMPFIPTNHRIISIEDTRELYLPKELYWTPLVTRPPNPEGEGQVTMLDLLVNSLRMRPDRIILGEMRRKAEAEVLFEAMHTGHSVYATVHADSSNETIKRLVNPPIEVPENLLEQVHLNVVMFRDRKRGIRRTYQVSEFVFEGAETSIKPNLLYRWNPANDKIVKHMRSLKLIEQLTRNTGSSQTEIDKDLAMRKKILEWMVKRNLRSIREVGSVMKNYYLDKDYVVKIVDKNSDPKSLIEND
ncbi:MAG: ATPase, T2SS/T4P/T4SS family [Nanoarchaeota archaeon]